MTRAEIDQTTAAEAQIIEMFKGKTRAEQDQILFDLERKLKYGDTLRNDRTGNGII